jgi:dihydrofolate reductase
MQQQQQLKGYVFIATSLDGYIATQNGNIDWLTNQPTIEGEDFGFADFVKSMDVMLMGRKTFDVVQGFGKEGWAYGDLPVVVWTRDVNKVQVPEWLATSVSVQSAASPMELWQQLQVNNAGYQRAYIDGGKTIQSFLNAGLIQEITITRIPILLGDGIPLFSPSEDGKIQPLIHLSTQAYPNGFVVSKYQVKTSPEDSQES